MGWYQKKISIFASMNPVNLWLQGQVGGYCFIKSQRRHKRKLTLLF